jgi:methionyl aminopeptidase
MTPAFKGFNGYNAASCLSVNYEVVHSIPRSYRLAEGDILSVDFGVTCNGWMVDTARTYGVGKVSNKTQKLIDVTAQALDLALEQARVGKTTGDIGHVIQKCVEDEDFYIIRDLTGHGVGRTLQESPSIPNHGHAGGGVPLKEDMVLAIEPIVATVKCHIGILDDGWTIITDNGAEAAHFEDTVMVTSSGPKILTR